MRFIDNARTMVSTFAGFTGGGVALAGWLAKAATPESATIATKATTAAVTALTIGGTTFAALQYFLPMTIDIGGRELTLHSSLVGNYLAATWAGAWTAISYTAGVGREAPAKPVGRTLRSF